MNKRKFAAFVLSTFLLSFCLCNISHAYEEDKKVLTLKDCIDAAIKNNLSLKKAGKKMEWGENRIGEAKADYFPKIDFNAEYFRTESSLGEDSDYSTSLDLSHTLFDFGTRSSTVKMEESNLEVYQYEREAELQKVVSEVRQAYYSILHVQSEIDILNAKKNLSEKHLEKSKEVYAVGLAVEREVLRAESESMDSKDKISIQKDELKILMSRLSHLTGIENIEDYKLDQISSENLNKQVNAKTEDAVTIALNNRPELKAYSAKQVAVMKKLEREKKLAFPSLSWGLNYVFGGAKFLFEKGFTVTGLLNIPLFSGFSTKYRIKQVEAELNMIEKEKEIEKQIIEIDVKSSIKRLHEAYNRFAVKKKLLEEAHLDLMLAEEKYNVGLASEIDLMEEQVKFSQVSKEYNDSLINYLKALDKYELSTGSL
jgi:outer membrane protein TolC